MTRKEMNDMKTADKVLYICNREKCEHCTASEGMCQHTSDVKYAANFVKVDDDVYMETEVARLVTLNGYERPQGEWEESHICSCGKILQMRMDVIEHKCKNCGRWSIKWERTIPDNFCPNCGAEMKSFKDCTELHKES